MRTSFALFAVTAVLVACDDASTVPGSDATATPPLITPPNGGVVPRVGLFSATVTRVTLEIDYQAGAAPEVGRYALGTRDTWGIFNTNIRRIFREASPREIDVPTTLDAMESLAITTPADGAFAVGDILDIARNHQDSESTAAHRVFYVLFLDGFFRGANGDVNRNVIGVSLGSTGVIAMFKPVIRQSSTARFVEQTTLVHEFGHALGLVNNGIAPTGTHHDAEHGAHCSNRDCVMYFAHEGLADLAAWVARFVTTGDAVVLGDECLADIDTIATTP